ncbi:MAG: twin-arginine translocase subunit TatC [Desulfobulbaceae bacterium]|nr:twin-arginine translocase subunit TatC [Desulfobulbaceae bacterium]HIJ77757.1 twin-arginine translocase subunit TatC [Deltaproteobacteria bacterium]
MSNELTGYFANHLQELRKRVLISFIAIFVATATAYYFSEQIVGHFVAPLVAAHPDLANLVYTNLTEAFVAYLKVSLLVGLVVSFPVCGYQFWKFVAPGLHQNEKQVTRHLVFWGTLLFACGVAFAYFVVLPKMLSFLLSFVSERLEPLPKLDAYLTFVSRTVLTFGLSFEIPFLMVMATKVGVVRKGYFARQRKYFYIAIVVLSFLLAVGDLLSTVMLAVPLFGLYEIGILISRPFKGKVEPEGN